MIGTLVVGESMSIRSDARSRRIARQPRRRRPFNVASLVAATQLVATAVLAVLLGPASTAGASGTGQGYLLVGSDGGAFAYGNVGYYGSEAGQQLTKPIVGASVTNNGGGYIEIGGDGGVFVFGNAPNDGSIYQFGNGSSQSWFGGNIVGGALTSDNGGYWLVSNNGVVCGFGDAAVYNTSNQLLGTNWCWFVGSISGIVGFSAEPANGGYWFVTNTGGVYAFGGASYYGGSPGISNAVGMASTIDGGGYRLVGSDGGVFAYGDAAFYGSVGGASISNVTGILTIVHFGGPYSSGYALARSNGALFLFGDAAFLGSMEDQFLAGPIVGIS
jgi:hypothetical protein